MNEKLSRAQDIVLSRVSHICNKFGLNNIMAQLYTVLYLSGKPLSLDDMVDRLKISKGSASVNIRALERYGVVRRFWVKGSRKDFYEAEADITKVILERIQSMAEGGLSEVNDMLVSSHKELSSIAVSCESEDVAVKVFKGRIDELARVYDQARSMLEVFKLAMHDQVALNDKMALSKDSS